MISWIVNSLFNNQLNISLWNNFVAFIGSQSTEYDCNYSVCPYMTPSFHSIDTRVMFQFNKILSDQHRNFRGNFHGHNDCWGRNLCTLIGDWNQRWLWRVDQVRSHYSDVIMSAITYHITSISIVCSAICWDAHQRNHRSSLLLAFVRRIHHWPGQ